MVIDSTVIQRPTTLTPTVATVQSGQNTPAGQQLLRALGSPHILIDAGTRAVDLPVGTQIDSTLVVLAPRVTLAASVRGDVVVVGGDLFVHPGARITGDAVAIGGGVYHSSLATIGGGIASYRDETFDIVRARGRVALSHQTTQIESDTRLISLPLRFGVRTPSYNRVDGLVLPWGPLINLTRGRLTLDPTVTYRSDIGAIDPGMRAVATFGTFELTADARRATYSNDRWIRGDIANSITTLFSGSDKRNYYRADRFESRLGTRWQPGDLTFEPYVGAMHERAWSTGGGLSLDSHPWSLLGRDSIDGIFRPNPPVFHGRIASGLAGAALGWTSGDVRARLDANIEYAWDTPPDPSATPEATAGEFTQTTLHGTVTFPTFADQSLELRARAVTSSKREKRPPPQRFSYLGGGGTIPTLHLLEQGGSELFFFQANYIIPIPVIELPLVGSPIFTLKYLTGSAGVDSLPRFTQNVGARVGLRFIGAQYVVDPETKKDHFGVTLTLNF